MVMSDDVLKRFMDNLKDILNHPPYLIFVFLTSIFMVVSMTTHRYYEQSLALFLYSVFGAVWRHAVKDVRGRQKEAYPESHTVVNFWLTLFYQLVNLLVVLILTIYMLKLFTDLL